MTKTVRIALRGCTCAAVLAFPLLRGEEESLRLDAPATKVEFALSATLHTVHGEFRLKEGTLRFDPATGRVSGQVTVDARSGQTGNATRDRRMHQEILETERYPEIVFRPDRSEGAIAPGAVSQVKLHGVVAIHGGEHEITVPAEVRSAPGGGYDVTIHFEVPYVKWGIKNPSTFLLRVSETVQIAIHTVALP
jgi:polyisoprenoid-binding protein YceI